MKIAVLGAGLAGITAAWALRRDGHDIVVIDRQLHPASETSFANAGLISPGHAFAWASPKVPGILLRSLYRGDQAFRLKPKLDLAMWRWMVKFLGECTAEKARRNTLRKHRLCLYGQQSLSSMALEAGISYHATNRGLLYLYRTPQSLERGIANLEILAELGQKQEILDRAAVVRLEPALSSARDNFVGAVYCPTDGSGDAHVFTRSLADRMVALGVRFRLGEAIERIETVGSKVSSIKTAKGRVEADAYVVALGAYAPIILKPLKYRLPIYPVKGYSLTFPIIDPSAAPVLGGVDEDNLVAFSRLGDKLRLTATAEFSGYDTRHQPSDFSTMIRTGSQLFPGAAAWDQPNYWSCLRPMTPQGQPILGKGHHDNLWLCAGHGHMGWTMAAGTARILADLMAGRQADIDLEGLLYKS